MVQSQALSYSSPDANAHKDRTCPVLEGPCPGGLSSLFLGNLARGHLEFPEDL